ncbi:MAG: 2-hydroxyglutaryl-CoA dehydratase [Desulfobacteraceae bacterium]|uniref:2-hydroxyglutaryl-CoA dehydratase n=1 Tax=Candidatus Desulfacyla euxinica TaxID=2841693 RepID=A0A8J6N2A7_9DELT|nr:2-hydroxyglutaryl-CoA dehydratase [Candidatus Desulfacyla euxinica]MBL6977645.1 2-hydroxyglutaryl-CoA dehydratase [Desulfobacteraceae bacterium]
MSQPIVAGCDVGSIWAKAVIFDGKEILASAVIPSSPFPAKTAEKVLEKAANKAGVSMGDIEYVVGTGYGRVNVPNAKKTVSEIACHAKGAAWSCSDVATLIDVGGQDCKVISLASDGHGRVMDFSMNDKCAAGTGRFLEVMAGVFELPIEEFGERALKAERILGISSQCTVFAESEVVCLIAQGHEIEQIIAGICDAVAARVSVLVPRVGLREKVYMSGGVAKNIGVRQALQRRLRVTIWELTEDPLIIGALGAAVLAMDALRQQQ